jgi:lipopolysaccharide export LptBFGC system permease protein LptF
MYIKYVVLTASLLASVACTHTPTMGENMINQSESTRELGEQWRAGEKSVLNAKKQSKNGAALAKQGHQNIIKGNKLVSKGENQVADGKQLMKQAKHETHKGEALQKSSEHQFNELIQITSHNP